YGYSSVEADLRKLSDIRAWVQVPRCMAWLDYNVHVNSLSTMDNDVGVTSLESTTQTLPSFEEYTPPMTYLEEAEKTLGTPIEVEPLNETKLEEVGLNCNHNIPRSSREISSFDEPEPQPNPLPNFPSLDVSLGEERGPEPPIKPHSPDNFRMKEVDHLTNHTLPSPHVASFHAKDTYCYYHPCIGDPKKHYGFKLGLLGHSGSLGVDFSNMEMIENEWELESKEDSFLGRILNSPVRPKEVKKVRIKETHHLEHIIQQPISQHMAPSHHDGKKTHLLEDKQFPSVGVLNRSFSGGRHGGNTRDLGSFREKTDKTTDLHQHLLRISTQKLETASQITRDAVTTHLKTASQDLKTASECMTQPII
ncbi:hypothetical protein Tco_0618026, partial [Tanacetum coccineum]